MTDETVFWIVVGVLCLAGFIRWSMLASQPQVDKSAWLLGFVLVALCILAVVAIL